MLKLFKMLQAERRRKAFVARKVDPNIKELLEKLTDKTLLERIK